MGACKRQICIQVPDDSRRAAAASSSGCGRARSACSRNQEDPTLVLDNPQPQQEQKQRRQQQQQLAGSEGGHGFRMKSSEAHGSKVSHNTHKQAGRLSRAEPVAEARRQAQAAGRS